MQKPIDIEEYKKWLREHQKCHITDQTINYYDSVSRKIFSIFSDSDFWNELNASLKTYQQQYHLSTNFDLLTSDNQTKLNIKDFDSFLLKTFRKNVIENPNWPDEPNGGWILSERWYSQINDIVRTMFVAKYLDGATFLSDKIKLLLDKHNLPCNIQYEAKEEGYYALHMYTTFKCEIPTETWKTTIIDTTIELQITTQLQEVIRKLLHKYYEERRGKITLPEIKWQWNYKSGEFAANYLGHILHYIEGMIMEVRKQQEG